ncbi:MAG: two pore domain potassium channel family protein [Planctomycetota bacterium]|nr:MAG: two pore domain potassium channel family protein [Planctomycetota bacterium]
MILLLALGLGMYVLTLAVQMAPVAVLIHIATKRHPGSLLRPSYRANLILLQLLAALLLLAHLVNIGLWAVLLCLCGEFAGFEAAYYHSAVNYSSLGYGDIVMSTRWRLLGPLEAIDGIVMFGISTALIFALLMRLIERRIKAKGQETDWMSQPSGDRK